MVQFVVSVEYCGIDWWCSARLWVSLNVDRISGYFVRDLPFRHKLNRVIAGGSIPRLSSTALPKHFSTDRSS